MQHHSCKNIDITNPEVVFPWVLDCIRRHIKRFDFRHLLISHGMPRAMYDAFVSSQGRDYTEITEYVRNIAVDATERIKRRDLGLHPVRIRIRQDRTSGKIRYIGDEEAMQQVFDFIAKNSCNEIWDRRILPQQVSSIKGRGQIVGINYIAGWIRDDNRYIRYCKSHKIRYTSKCKHHGKADVKQCYPSGRVEVFMSFFHKDCENDDILWLWETLLLSHRVIITGTDEIYMGFMIGSVISQWAMQYLISFAFRVVLELRNKRGARCVYHALTFLDDILVMGSSRKDVRSAINKLTAYAKDFLKLEIKPNWHIKCLDDCGVDMMGFVIHRSGKITLRARNFVKNRRMYIRFRCRNGNISIEQARRICSQKGAIVNSNSQAVVKNYGLKDIFATAQRVVARHDKEANNGYRNVQSKT